MFGRLRVKLRQHAASLARKAIKASKERGGAKAANDAADGGGGEGGGGDDEEGAGAGDEATAARRRKASAAAAASKAYAALIAELGEAAREAGVEADAIEQELEQQGDADDQR